jgi:hypothetical protein
MAYQIGDFAFDLRQSTAPPEHIWANSGYSTAAPLPHTVLGVRGCFSPPFVAKDLQLELRLIVGNRTITDTGSTGKGDCGLLYAGAEWLPDRIKRRGTYHWQTEEGLVSLAVRSELVPLSDRAGFMLIVRVKNRSGRTMPLSLEAALQPGHPRQLPLHEWQFGIAWAGEEAAAQQEDGVWETGQVRITLLHDGSKDVILERDGEAVFRLAVVLTPQGEAVEGPAELAAWDAATRETWERRLERANQSVPQLASDIPGLEAYYRRSLISGLVCEWEHPAFVTRPFIATCGIEGGGICSYLWDNAGYSGQMLSLLLGGQALEHIRQMASIDMDEHYCVTPAGTGRGVWYSFSLWSFFHFAWSIITQHGIGWELYPLLKERLISDEKRLPETDGLLDYGRQHNLLEMRGSGYEHIVPSPNAERAWCCDRLADLAERLGESDAQVWRDKAARIREKIRENLWDEETGWFACQYPDGHREIIYSIQVFNALRMGVCTPDMEKALLSHVRDGAFLGEYGVSSISARDEQHYELLDPDWSGGGAYTGSGPQLAQTLWEAGQPELAWDVLKRFFWMGRHLPYYPQEHYCDSPLTPAHKRANIISGVCGVQAVIYGMAGFRPELDGSLWVNPQPPQEGRVTLTGYPFRGHLVDVHMEPGFCRIVCDGETVYSGAPCLWRAV